MESEVSNEIKSSNPPVQIEKKSSHRKTYILLTIILFVLILISTAYYLGTKNNTTITNSENQNNNSNQVLNTITPTNSTIPTENWNTNSSDLLSFQYPSDWKETQDTISGGYILLSPINNNSLGMSISKFLSTNPNETPEQLAKQALGMETAVNKKQISVNNHDAIYQERHYPNNIRIEVYVGNIKEINNTMNENTNPETVTGTHSIYMDINNIEQLEYGRNIFNQILSTFKYPL